LLAQCSPVELVSVRSSEALECLRNGARFMADHKALHHLRDIRLDGCIFIMRSSCGSAITEYALSRGYFIEALVQFYALMQCPAYIVHISRSLRSHKKEDDVFDD